MSFGQILYSSDVDNQKLPYYPSDSTEVLRLKYKPETNLEKVVSFPGRLVYFPFKMIFRGIKGTIIWYDEAESARWLRNLLTPQITVKRILPTYSTRSGLGLIYFNDTLIRNAKFSITAKAGLDGRSKIQLKITPIPLNFKKMHSDIIIMYRLLTIETFYGVGPNSKKSDKTNFSHEIAKADFAFGTNVQKLGIFHIHLGIEQNNILPGKDNDYPSTTDVYSKEELPGLDTGLRFGWLALSYTHNTLRAVQMRQRGSATKFSWYLYNQIQDNQFQFWKFIADYRQFFHLFYNRYLLLRFAGEITEPMNDKQIPFFHLGELGRRETIRGFDRGRFRDKDMVLGSVELIYPLWKMVKGIVFFDTGEVNHRMLKDFSLKKLQYGYGGGFRLVFPNMFLLSLEFGFSREGYRVYFDLNV